MSRPWYKVARDRKKSLDISLEEIGRRMGGVSKSTVGAWFTGRNRPGFDVIADIARALECTVTELICEDSYYLTDPQERAIIDQVREIPAPYLDGARLILAAYAAGLPKPQPPASTPPAE